MKFRSILTSLLAHFLLVSTATAQNAPPSLNAKPLAAESKITAVTLYRGRASITRTATIQLEPGVFDVQITGLPESIQPQSLQARAQGPVKVLNVDFSQEQTAAPTKQFADIDAKIEDLQRQIKEIGEQRDLLKVQEQFIDSLSAKAAADSSKDAGTAKFDLDAMRKQLAFIAEERGKLLTARRDLDKSQRELEKQLHAAQANRAAIAGTANVLRTATVSIAATEAGTANIELIYLVNNATWEPTYNIRASIDAGTAQIEYDAMLTQRTGEDWDEVKLTLSTAQPALAANPPALQPWFIEVHKPEIMGKALHEQGSGGRGIAYADARALADKAPPAPATGAAEPELRRKLEELSADAEVAGGGPSVSFELPRAVTINSNTQKQQNTRIATIDTKAKFIHVAVPMLTDAVYIRGDLANSSAYQLLPGRASVFVGQDYIGPTTLVAVAPAGEFKLHFGIDQSVKATRQLVAKKTESTGLLGGGRRTSYDYRTVIDNGTGTPITLELWDRYPISRSEEIQVEIVDLSNPIATDAKYLAEEKPQGLLKWLLNIPATAKGKTAQIVTYGVRINRAKDVEMTPLPE